MDLKIEYLPKAELVAYKNNAKIHTEDQIEQIRKSIREFGFNDPIAIWKGNEIIEGHGRLLAVLDMPEIDMVPVIRLDDLSDEERKAYALVHNKITMNTGFDFEALQAELARITDIDMTEFGFITADQVNAEIDDFFIADEPKPAEDPKITFSIRKPDGEKYDDLVSFLKKNSIDYKEK